MTIPHLVLAAAWAGAVAGPLVLWALCRTGLKWVAAPLLAVYLLCVWVFLIEPRLLTVRRVTIDSAAWSGAPLRIGVVSDTHAGAPYGSPARIRRAVERLNTERPDLIVFVGDYAGGHEPASVRAAKDRSTVLAGVAALGAARAPLGRVAVLGNHDWWYDGAAIESGLRRAGLTVLENSAVRVERAGDAFWVAGLADMESSRASPSATEALESVPPGEPAIVLTHWPDTFPTVPASVALTLAAHSHCGQVDLPILGRLVHASAGSARWPCGLYEEAGRKMFVTGGVGVSILPVRFRAPPEVAVVTLRGPTAP